MLSPYGAEYPEYNKATEIKSSRRSSPDSAAPWKHGTKQEQPRCKLRSVQWEPHLIQMQTETCSALLSLPGRLPASSRVSALLVQPHIELLVGADPAASSSPGAALAFSGSTSVNANTQQPGPGPDHRAPELHPCPPAWGGRKLST